MKSKRINESVFDKSDVLEILGISKQVLKNYCKFIKVEFDKDKFNKRPLALNL